MYSQSWEINETHYHEFHYVLFWNCDFVGLFIQLVIVIVLNPFAFTILCLHRLHMLFLSLRYWAFNSIRKSMFFVWRGKILTNKFIKRDYDKSSFCQFYGWYNLVSKYNLPHTLQHICLYYLKCLQKDHKMNVDFLIIFWEKKKSGWERGDGEMKYRS